MNKKTQDIMNTQWIYKVLLVVCLPILLFACNESDFLDLTNPNNPTGKEFWTNKRDVDAAVATAYQPLAYQMNGWFGATTGWLDQQSRGDDIFTVLNEEVPSWEVATFTNDPGNSKNTYGYLYVGIQRANVILANIDNVPASEISDTERSASKGEAYFLRAYQYFLLVHNFKEVPLRTIPSKEELMKEAASEEAVWKQVKDDLKAAIDSELPITRLAIEKGRVEKGAAIALLAKVHATLHEYKEAKELLEQLMKAPYSYQLMANYEDNFIPTTEYNKESIFEISYANSDYTWNNGRLAGIGNSLPQWLGSPKSGGWMKLAPSAFIVEEFIKEKKTSGTENNYNGRKFDERMYASLFFDTKAYGDANDESANWYDGNYTMDDLWESANTSKLAAGAPELPQVNGKPGKFLLKKYTAHWLDNPNADNMQLRESKGNNVRAFRYAEVLMLHAEACYKTGDEARANSSLNMIRERAGLPNKTFSGDALWNEIVRQNLLEFFNEGHRFEDLKRWYTYDEIKEIFIKNKKQGAENFQPKHFYYPIPLSELRDNIKMKQNSAWASN